MTEMTYNYGESEGLLSEMQLAFLNSQRGHQKGMGMAHSTAHLTSGHNHRSCYESGFDI